MNMRVKLETAIMLVLNEHPMKFQPFLRAVRDLCPAATVTDLEYSLDAMLTSGAIAASDAGALMLPPRPILEEGATVECWGRRYKVAAKYSILANDSTVNKFMLDHPGTSMLLSRGGFVYIGYDDDKGVPV